MRSTLRLEAPALVGEGLRGELHPGPGVLLFSLLRCRLDVLELLPSGRPVLRLHNQNQIQIKSGRREGSKNKKNRRDTNSS